MIVDLLVRVLVSDGIRVPSIVGNAIKFTDYGEVFLMAGREPENLSASHHFANASVRRNCTRLSKPQPHPTKI
jgi:hypothetical protein